jgi:hypothetical protein
MLATASYINDLLATQVQNALRHIANEMHLLDGYPTSTLSDGIPTGSSEATSVERALMARQGIQDRLALIRRDADALTRAAHALGQLCQKVLGERLPRFDVPQCDGRDYEGSHLPWVPHSRDPANGWYDPKCTEAADESGLCPRCRIRERRFRQEHDLAPRASNVATPAAVA